MTKAILNGSAGLSFHSELQQLHLQNKLSANKLHLVISKDLNEDDLQNLLAYCAANNQNFFFSRLSLQVNQSFLVNASFISLIEQLKDNSIVGLDLCFSSQELTSQSSAISDLLLSTIAPLATFPILINEITTTSLYTKRYQSEELKAFQEIVINNLHEQRHVASVSLSASSPTKQFLSANIPSQKNTLKELIKKKATEQQYSRYLTLETQHTEVVQQQEVVQVLEEEIELQLQHQYQEILSYQGELVGYSDFAKIPPLLEESLHQSLCQFMRGECFANLPHAIKYFSPLAAQQMVESLAAYATLNIHNLPQGFLLKTTVKGELVLDYDPYALDKKINPFTPTQPHLNYEESQPIYALEPEILAELDAPMRPKLVNLWIRFGEKGVHSFLAALEKIEQRHTGFSSYLLTHYLAFFPHWDHFLDNNDFFSALTRLSRYETVQLICLKQFLQNTGSSRHDLLKTLEAFDTFWLGLARLGNEQKTDINLINTNWFTPPGGGNPAVYMERMLTILTNARNLKEQLHCLSGLSLANYEAYYASQFEGFKTLSAKMRFRYNPEKQDQRYFNKNSLVYSMSINYLYDVVYDVDYYKTKSDHYWLISSDKVTLTLEEFKRLEQEEKAFPLIWEQYTPSPSFAIFLFDPQTQHYSLAKKAFKVSNQRFYTYAYRFLGQQAKGISLPVFQEALEKNHNEYFATSQAVVFNLLLLTSHERYEGVISLSKFIYDLKTDSATIDYVNKAMLKLYQLGVKLNDSEASILYEPVGDMNSCEFEHGGGVSKDSAIRKIFAALFDNKYAMLRVLNHRSNRLSSWPLVYVIDTANYLALEPQIKTYYGDDLLLFADLLMRGAHVSEIYFERNIPLPLYDDYRQDSSLLILYGSLDEKELAEQKLDRSTLDKLQRKKEEKKERRETAEKKDAGQKESVKITLDKIKSHLLRAVSQPQPNNFDYAFKLLLQTSSSLNYSCCLEIFAALEQLGTDFSPQAVDALFLQKRLTFSNQLTGFFNKAHPDLEMMIIQLIMLLNSAKAEGDFNSAKAEEIRPTSFFKLMVKVIEGMQGSESEIVEGAKEYEELSQLTMSELQATLKDKWQESGRLLSGVGQFFLTRLLTSWRNQMIDSTFEQPIGQSFLKLIASQLKSLHDFADCNDFEKLGYILNQADALSYYFKSMVKNTFFQKKEEVFIRLFKQGDLSRLDYEFWHPFARVFSGPGDYLGILEALFTRIWQLADKEEWVALMDGVERLFSKGLPVAYIEKIVGLINDNSLSEQQRSHFMLELIELFSRDNDDPLLKFLLLKSSYPFALTYKMMLLTQPIRINREILQQFIAPLGADCLNELMQVLEGIESDRSCKVLAILAKSEALDSQGNNPLRPKNYVEISQLLLRIGANNLAKLHQFFQTSAVGAGCLLASLKNNSRNTDFNHFLSEFEKAPYGARQDEEQFDCSQVERVVNGLLDSATALPYSYQYRKQLMEAFLFVNMAGYQLPLYYNKAAKKLTNQEIKTLFTGIKEGKFAHLTPFQSRLYALALMREAMYRSTGQFPYSTQMIAIIDAMMHQGDIIQNIHPGQGKSLIDSMKAALLWLGSQRVEMTTLSVEDARRDITNYASFFRLLNIPYSEQPIIATSPFSDFKLDGVNVSTFVQLALFFNRAHICGYGLGQAKDCFSLVSTESDYVLLEENIISRYAGPHLLRLTKEHNWLYDALNVFVCSEAFCLNDTTEAEDVNALRAYLIEYAKQHQKAPKITYALSDEQLLTWINSALLANYHLKENDDYLLSEHSPRVIKILMKPSYKINPNSQFGEGIQQLLQAKLNQRLETEEFVIEAENQTFISANNKNLLDYYRRGEGFIWMSSGTTGSKEELAEQGTKYGFQFSTIEPHQEQQVIFHQPQLYTDEQEQFKQLAESLLLSIAEISSPHLVFCKDVETAKRLFDALQPRIPELLQCYTGIGEEAAIIRRAATAGMVTITTSALGRNTDIRYAHDSGMDVWHTCPDSTRAEEQKSRRTGRQGSPGNVYYLFNQQDLPNNDLNLFRQKIEAQARVQRQFNEELYNLLGYLLNQILQIPVEQFKGKKEEFIKQRWAKFSKECEFRYRDTNLHQTYHQAEFVAAVLQDYEALVDSIQMIPLCVKKVLQAMNEKFSLNSAPIEKQYHGNVLLTDCAPVLMAYSFLEGSSSFNSNKTKIKAKLALLFKEVDAQNFDAKNIAYLSFLNRIRIPTKVLKAAHQEFFEAFLEDLLQEFLRASVARGFFQLSIAKTKLNQIASDRNYLLMLQTCMATFLSDQPIRTALLVRIVAALLNAYENNLFLNAAEREERIALLNVIQQATTNDELTNALLTSQTTIAKQDIADNQSQWYRKIKPVNLFGESRFQTLLSQALNLVTSLSCRQNDKIIKSLTALFPSVLSETLAPLREEASLDELQLLCQPAATRDNSNLQVLQASLKNALIKRGKEPSNAMIGRHSIFLHHQKIKEPQPSSSGAPSLN